MTRSDDCPTPMEVAGRGRFGLPGSTPKQTLSFLKRRFSEAGIRPRTQLGQNFLIDQNLLEILLEAAQLTPGDVVLEVGTGTGALTALVAPRVAAVVTTEIDRRLFHLAGEQLQAFSNVTMFCTDALKAKNRMNPEVLAAVSAQCDAFPAGCFKLVANLPYHVATPLITNLLALERPPERMAVTVQKEMADRLVASPGTKAYGALSVWVQCQCGVEVLRILPPSVFWPRPKVSSAFVRMTLDADRRAALGDRAFLHDFLRRLFLHRRKNLRAQLRTAVQDRLDKTVVDGLLGDLGLAPTLRAEQLGVDVLLRLATAVSAACGPI